MMTLHYWDRNILVHFANRVARRRILQLAVVLLCAAPGWTQSLETLASAFHEKPTSQKKAALVRFAEQHPKDTSGALALLVVGQADVDAGKYAEAIPRLHDAKNRLPSLADYCAYYLAEALYGSEAPKDALEELDLLLHGSPASPLRRRAVFLAAKILRENGQAEDAARLLRQNLSDLPQPTGMQRLAASLEAAKDRISAAAYYQRVYYEYPTSPEAKDAESALSRLRRALGRSYPPAMPQAMLGRVAALMKARQHLQARRELQELTRKLGGAERDLARVRLGVGRYLREHNTIAYRYLKSLKVSSPEADAERLYYLLACERRLDKDRDVIRTLGELRRKYPDSHWLLEGLVAAGNHYLVLNEPETYEPIYRACFESFPSERRAGYCHWKVTWSSYMQRRPEAAKMLREHVKLFPASEKASTALYFLGRLAEAGGDLGAAKTYYEEIVREYPNYYYAILARDRLDEPSVSDAVPSSSVQSFLKSVAFPTRSHVRDFEPTPATTKRIQRARLLSSAGLTDWAETELFFGAKTDAQPQILAMELARSAGQRGAHYQAIRYIKALASGYLLMPLDSAPASFWEMAFPLPFRSELERYCRARSLDVNFLAALIRQESEFNPRAVSSARAYGLTQILPSTGRQLSRKLGIRRFRTSMLYRPDINLNMGTYYLRALLDSLDGRAEAALASYNAGKSRVVAWLSWAGYKEPAEFIESIPFTETRNYIQTVLRNADIYRRLYGGKTVAAVSQKDR
jgi:soluble lytic murein transglycosylase